MKISLVVTMDLAFTIGDGKALPWQKKMPRDMARFRSLTMGKPILMGRRTFDIIGRSLPGRRNVVVSRNSFASLMAMDGISVFRDLWEALRSCESEEEAMIVGGEIYTDNCCLSPTRST